ncbi:MAG: thermonuclease family protein [Propionibacteriaceae bacterium]|nr:thermonuclease family protein [Propionibacteriaceae bacterium]
MIAANVPGAEAYGNTEQVDFAAGETHRFLLLYLVPATVADVDLTIDGQELDLSPAFSSAVPISTLAAEPAPADLLEATVTEVIDASTIEVEVDGIRQQVRYLGIDAPTGDACFAADATALNTELVAGETVWLERQRSNVDRQNRLLRDVWVRDDAGDLVLVAERLVGEGAAESATTMPNTRLRGWLDAAQAVAERSESGIWSAECAAERAAVEDTTTGATMAGIVPVLLGGLWTGSHNRRAPSPT